MLLQEQNQCRVTHKSVSHATQCDSVLLSQQGFCWPSGLCFRLSTIYCHPLLTWPHVTSHAHWGSLNCSQVKDHCAMEGALHDRQTSDPPQSDKKSQADKHMCMSTHTLTENLGACGATWPDRLMAQILSDHCLRYWQLQGETNQHPQGCTAQTAQALMLSLLCF